MSVAGKYQKFPKNSSFRPTGVPSKPIDSHRTGDSTMKAMASNIAHQRGEKSGLSDHFVYRRLEQRERIAINKLALGSDKKALNKFYTKRMGGVYTQKDYNHIYGIYQDGEEKMFENKRPMHMKPGDVVMNNMMGEIGILQDNQDRGPDSFLIFQDRSFKVPKDSAGWSVKLMQDGDAPVAATSAQGPALFKEQIDTKHNSPNTDNPINIKQTMQKIMKEVDHQDHPLLPKNDLLVSQDDEYDFDDDDDGWGDDTEFADDQPYKGKPYSEKPEGVSQKAFIRGGGVFESKSTGVPRLGPVGSKQEGQFKLQSQQKLTEAAKTSGAGPGSILRVGKDTGYVTKTGTVKPKSNFDTKAQQHRPFDGSTKVGNVEVAKSPSVATKIDVEKPIKVTHTQYFEDTLNKFKMKRQDIQEQMNVHSQTVKKGGNMQSVHKASGSSYGKLQSESNILNEKITNTEKYINILKEHTKSSQKNVVDSGSDLNKYTDSIQKNTMEKGGKKPIRPGFKSPQDKTSYGKGPSAMTGTKQEKQHHGLLTKSQPLTSVKKGEEKQISSNFLDIDVDKLKRSDIIFTRKGGKEKPMISDLENFPHNVMNIIKSGGADDVEVFTRSRMDKTLPPTKRSSYMTGQVGRMEKYDEKSNKKNESTEWSKGDPGYESKKRQNYIPVKGGKANTVMFNKKPNPGSGIIPKEGQEKVRKTGTGTIRTQKTDIEKLTDVNRVTNVPGFNIKSFTESAKKTFDFGGTPSGNVVSQLNNPDKQVFDISKPKAQKSANLPIPDRQELSKHWMSIGKNPHAKEAQSYNEVEKQLKENKKT